MAAEIGAISPGNIVGATLGREDVYNWVPHYAENILKAKKAPCKIEDGSPLSLINGLGRSYVFTVSG